MELVIFVLLLCAPAATAASTPMNRTQIRHAMNWTWFAAVMAFKDDRSPTPGCCSFDRKQCSDSEWCNKDPSQCAECDDSVWMLEVATDCTGRWQGCEDSSECCGSDLECLDNGSYRGCFLEQDIAVVFCCSWDHKNCGDEDFCNESSSNCEDSCEGNWVNPTLDCIAEWQGCDTNEDCCGEGALSCYVHSEYAYQGCFPAAQAPTSGNPPPTPPSTTPAPVTPVTPAPVSPVSPAPVTNPSPVTLTPTGSWPSLPTSGPFVAAGYSERITIPEPAIVADSDAQRNCPHDASGLVKWSTLSATANQDVSLPANTQVLLDKSPEVSFGYITIPSTSSLVIGESDDDEIALRAAGINVLGKLIAGSESCRIQNTQIRITLYGSRPANAPTVPEPEYKGVNVQGGEVSLHGKRFSRTWTRLSTTALAGSDVLMLQHQTNWKAGQQLVVVTTAVKDSKEAHENEVVTIQHVYDSVPGGVGSAVVIDPPLQYRHSGISNYQAEVGLLSRMIVIEGDASDSEPTDPDPLTCTGDWRFGDNQSPCPDKDLTGFGAHVIVHEGGVGQVEGIELRRVGQTNFLGRYPIHFHELGDCPSCYFKDSSVHRSYYRCISIHGTNDMLVTENVAYDVTGYCYYMEDGVEVRNTISYNLAAHIHPIGNIPKGYGQTLPFSVKSNDLILPADVTASGFYVTNIDNDIIGNTASGGWAGFAFPNLPRPVGSHSDINMRPSAAHGMMIDGNTAHSSGWWFQGAGAFYFGGALFVNDEGNLAYNPGRPYSFDNSRFTCQQDFCPTGNCFGWCEEGDRLWVKVTNTKTYLAAGAGLNSWSGRMEIIGYESHDTGMALQALEAGFWIDNLLAVCRSGDPVSMSSWSDVSYMEGTGFQWYDTGQEHIITDSTFRNCGLRSSAYNQYNSSPTRGCASDDTSSGCVAESSVFSFLAHSDTFNPEIMQGTRGIQYENCGRRFRLANFNGDDEPSTISGRLQNWLDVDGSASGLGEPTIMGSGYSDCGMWWEVDESVVEDPHGPLKFIRIGDGPQRALGHFHMEWDASLHDGVGDASCGNGNKAPCPTVGTIRHRGPKYAGDSGLPIKAQGDAVGLTGGYGWFLEFNQGSPKSLKLDTIEADPESPMLLSLAYPVGTTFDISAHAAEWCWESDEYTCSESFQAVSSIDQVRQTGNTYHFSNTGILTLRIVQFNKLFTGAPDWTIPTWGTPDRGDWFALDRFERKGIRLPMSAYGSSLTIEATTCMDIYCAKNTATADDVCPPGQTQESYDRCCQGDTCTYP